MSSIAILLTALLSTGLQAGSPRSDGRIVIPFETGQMSYSLRFWSTGREECTATSTGPRFEAAAAEACRQALAGGNVQPAPGGDLLVHGTITMSVVRTGETPNFTIGPTSASALVIEADIELAADGSIVNCIPVRFQPPPGMTGGLDEICSGLAAQGPGIFVPTGSAPWRGRARFVTDAEGPFAGRFLSGAGGR
jgi:hypothetical protein